MTKALSDFYTETLFCLKQQTTAEVKDGKQFQSPLYLDKFWNLHEIEPVDVSKSYASGEMQTAKEILDLIHPEKPAMVQVLGTNTVSSKWTVIVNVSDKNDLTMLKLAL